MSTVHPAAASAIVTTAATVTTRTSAATDRAYAICARVLDPELPVLTLADLGVLRAVEVEADGVVTVTITPTYSGCPALEVMRRDLVDALHAEGFDDVRVQTVLTPAWTTDWITTDGQRKLLDHGIAPPLPRQVGEGPVGLALSVRCPQCGSPDTAELSRFGSTPCKALWRCNACREPFDSVKTL